MSLASQIRSLRLSKNLTQEQLAEMLSVSPQAVSKWESSGTYPDGGLLIPLARALGVSLDRLFENESTSMAELSLHIRRLLYEVRPEERMELARDICWQIERGLFATKTVMEKPYDPDELKSTTASSYILDDSGFTHVSNGSTPFFFLAPRPADGYTDLLRDREALLAIFSALSRPQSLDALIFLMQQEEKFTFDAPYLARICGLSEEETDAVLSDLHRLHAISQMNTVINGTPHTLYRATPSHKLIALMLLARETDYRGPYCLQSHFRTLRYFGERIR